MKKTGKIILLGIIVGVIVIGGLCVSQYNSMVGIREDVENQQANIDTMLQRRVDLIPNLVNTVKGYAKQEEEVITAVSDARAKLSGAQGMEEKATADGELSSALSRLLVVVENYPDLKSSEQFQSLSDELAGTENRIADLRRQNTSRLPKALKVYRK